MLDRETIIRLARETGLIKEWIVLRDEDEEGLRRFAALVAAAERDRESKMDAYIEATEFLREPEIEGDMLTIAYMDGYAKGVAAEREACAMVCEGWEDMLADKLAAAIRARGTNEAR